MALVYRDNAPVKFITGTYVGYDAENNDCNCFTKPWCQLVERADTTNYQVGATANSADLVTAGDFSTVCGVDWTCGTDWAIGASVAQKDPGIANQSLTQPLCIMSGRRYQVRFTIDLISAGTLTVILGSATIGTFTTTGTKTIFVAPTVPLTGTLLQFTDVAGTLDITIDNVSVFELSQIGYEIETQTGTSIFTDVSTSVASYFDLMRVIPISYLKS